MQLSYSWPPSVPLFPLLCLYNEAFCLDSELHGVEAVLPLRFYSMCCKVALILSGFPESVEIPQPDVPQSTELPGRREACRHQPDRRGSYFLLGGKVIAWGEGHCVSPCVWVLGWSWWCLLKLLD